MRNEKFADRWLKDFEERHGKATPEIAAKVRKLCNIMPKMPDKPNPEGRRAVATNISTGAPRWPQKLEYDEQEYQRLLIQYPDARRYLPGDGPPQFNPNFNREHFEIVLKKLGIQVRGPVSSPSGALVWLRDPTMKWPTADEYRERSLNSMRGTWAEVAERCRELGQPEPDPTQLAKWEAEYLESGTPEWQEEMDRVSLAWEEAHYLGDPTALKCEREFLDSVAKRETEMREHLEMMKKWFVANRGELKSPLWEILAAQVRLRAAFFRRSQAPR